MTPAEIKKTRLYRTLAPCVRKEDREELARMLAMVEWNKPQLFGWEGHSGNRLLWAFEWASTPQGHAYWDQLHTSLLRAGHACC